MQHEQVASLRYAYKGLFVGSEDVQTFWDFKEQTMSQIIRYHLFLQLCSFLLIPTVCHGQGEEGDDTARHVV